MKLYDILAMIDSSGIELPLYVDEKGYIPCVPQSVFKVTLRFMAEDETAVTVPISSPVLIPWYDCPVTAINPNEVEDSMDVWLDYSPYVIRKWKNKVLYERCSRCGCGVAKSGSKCPCCGAEIGNEVSEDASD